jgi:predicted  nucleic acid-binding Zn-ribbon protein
MNEERLAALQHEILKRTAMRRQLAGRLATLDQWIGEGPSQVAELTASRAAMADRLQALDDELQEMLQEIKDGAETSAESAVLVMCTTLVRTALGLPPE